LSCLQVPATDAAASTQPRSVTVRRDLLPRPPMFHTGKSGIIYGVDDRSRWIGLTILDRIDRAEGRRLRVTRWMVGVLVGLVWNSNLRERSFGGFCMRQ
jgi:hypothetical protein